MNIFIINEKCIGCMACERVAEDHFIIENRKATIISQPTDQESLFKVQNAVKACPTMAIEEALDVRKMTEDPFDEIIKLAYTKKLGESFAIIQNFKPTPMINMLEAMGFKFTLISEAPGDVKMRFTKIESEDIAEDHGTLPTLTIQSATPVGFPIIMKLLHSKRLREAIKIKELKIWEETEKHLAWIANEKADISFSAVITATKFKNAAVKMPAIFVWDNFVMLSKNTNAKSFKDLIGETIHMPLFEDAPPAKITRFLVESEGLQMSDYQFKYGDPFGRPKELVAGFLTGKADHVLLREPEASFAVAAAINNGINFNEISFGKLFNDAVPGFGLFPNAGVIVKESLYERHPEAMQIFEEELQAAIQWVNANKKEAANLSYDLMKSPIKNVELFLDRVHFEYQSGPDLREKMSRFFNILSDNNILPIVVDDQLMKMFG